MVAIIVEALFDVIQVGVYDIIRAEGIWGQGSQLRGDKEVEVYRVIII